MSSDEIFAAQMWSWPDPMIKRDNMGRILFINAAFLKMYGGHVQDWQGNTVSGWPNPQMSAVPNRFETRLPTQSGESIYDWIEYTLADSGTLAIARDVTDLMSAPQPDPAARFTAPPMNEHTAAASMASGHAPAVAAAVTASAVTATAFVNPLQNEAPKAADVVTDYVAPTYEAPVHEAPVFEAPIHQAPVHQAPVFETPVLDAPLTAPDVAAETAEAPLSAPAFEADATEYTNDHQEDVQVAPQAEAATSRASDGRDYERRALPIENEESLLGTNWRDAVIAKAVGSALPSEDDTQEAEAQDAAAAAPEPETGQLRILLAEDNAINALLTRTLLEAEGCDVDVVEDGQLAVEAMKRRSYDMIFMDMRMPNMDGLESTRKIRALPNVPKDLPIVALTANAFDDDRNACFDSGMNDFMTKPVSAEELSEMVQQWARKEKDVAA